MTVMNVKKDKKYESGQQKQRDFHDNEGTSQFRIKIENSLNNRKYSTTE